MNAEYIEAEYDRVNKELATLRQQLADKDAALEAADAIVGAIQKLQIASSMKVGVSHERLIKKRQMLSERTRKRDEAIDTYQAARTAKPEQQQEAEEA